MSFAPFDPTTANIYRYRQQQSVNLGSWFVHEQWMTPSLFECASGAKLSEIDLAYGYGSTDAARQVLERHWDTFINETDFEYLASIGINTVRLPIGYFSLGPVFCEDTPFGKVADVYRNCWPRIVRAINTAAKYGIGVLVDLHGAVGSQNGQPHSGISDGQTNLFNDPGNIEKTTRVLTFLVQQLSQVTNVVGVQILNEPQNVPELEEFYNRVISTLRGVSPEAASFPLYIHNGFDMPYYSSYVGRRSDFVVEDHHSYFVFTPQDDAEPASQHSADLRTSVQSALTDASETARRNFVVDEWSCALTPESLSAETNKEQARTDFCTGQLNLYRNVTAGYSFWCLYTLA
ncbi:glycoside hydrolase family 5 protein [Fistulina hepatica ATCC 64428]|uniref:Glycoside hydrolase family 5 protein n=1 Tax=Fistulina hepatica ATCC 64428 TaxID=1128425 RepID=A0A0D7AGT1_9AGAR|nr:glycoside hydrolase family 5 protein [Fistulina hepatica ATCC 64428]